MVRGKWPTHDVQKRLPDHDIPSILKHIIYEQETFFPLASCHPSLPTFIVVCRQQSTSRLVPSAYERIEDASEGDFRDPPGEDKKRHRFPIDPDASHNI